MTPSLKESKPFFTSAEWKIIESAMPGQIEKLTLTRVKQKVTMARRLQDKWNDQSIKQARAAGNKDAAVKTKLKAKHFSNVLKTFERLEKNWRGKP